MEGNFLQPWAFGWRVETRRSSEEGGSQLERHTERGECVVWMYSTATLTDWVCVRQKENAWILLRTTGCAWHHTYKKVGYYDFFFKFCVIGFHQGFFVSIWVDHIQNRACSRGGGGFFHINTHCCFSEVQYWCLWLVYIVESPPPFQNLAVRWAFFL